MSQSGIYKIVNTQNNHFYIGSTVDFVNRRKQHLYRLRRGYHHSRPLQRAFNKYGEEALEFIFIEEVPKDKQMLFERETYWVQTLRPHYNASKVSASNLGVKSSEATRRKLREIANHPEEIARRRVRLLGKRRPPEVIEKIKDARAQQPVTQKMLDSLAIGRAMPFELRKGMTGKRHHEATIQRMRDAITEEVRNLRSETMQAVWSDEEQRTQRSEAIRETWQDEDLRREQSEASKAMWNDEATRTKITESVKEAWQDEDLRREQSERGKARWQGMTEEEQRQHIAPTLTEEARQNRAKASKSMWSERSDEDRENILKATRSPEALRKRSESMKAMWRRKKGLDA